MLSRGNGAVAAVAVEDERKTEGVDECSNNVWPKDSTMYCSDSRHCAHVGVDSMSNRPSFLLNSQKKATCRGRANTDWEEERSRDTATGLRGVDAAIGSTPQSVCEMRSPNRVVATALGSVLTKVTVVLSENVLTGAVHYKWRERLCRVVVSRRPSAGSEQSMTLTIDIPKSVVLPHYSVRYRRESTTSTRVQNEEQYYSELTAARVTHSVAAARVSNWWSETNSHRPEGGG
jgi:hypothetical protein